jgi:hypothetical protein
VQNHPSAIVGIVAVNHPAVICVYLALSMGLNLAVNSHANGFCNDS